MEIEKEITPDLLHKYKVNTIKGSTLYIPLYIYIALVYKTTSEMFNQDTLICPNGVHNGEVPLCIPPLEPLYNLHLKRSWSV